MFVIAGEAHGNGYQRAARAGAHVVHLQALELIMGPFERSGELLKEESRELRAER